MNSLEVQVFTFVSRQTSFPMSKITLNTDIFLEVGLDGDDAYEFMDTFGHEFGVDLSNFDFDLYFGPEGFRLLWLFRQKFRKEKIAIRVSDLVTAVSAKKWPGP